MTPNHLGPGGIVRKKWYAPNSSAKYTALKSILNHIFMIACKMSQNEGSGKGVCVCNICQGVQVLLL